jgi:single-strand DNA-binding protein
LANLNRIILVGRLTSDPETRATLDGLPLTKFRLAVERRSGLGGTFQSGTDFMEIIAWRQLAEAAGAKLKKGELVLVEGRIQIRSFEDQTGQRRWATEIVARTIYPLASQNTGPLDSARGKQATGDDEVVDNELESDLPF